jgi:hypothetical protein
MSASARIDARRVVGRSPERLSLEERFALAGKYAAFEVYTPQTVPLRRIEAVGDSIEECVRQLQARGLDPERFEFIRLAPPY